MTNKVMIDARCAQEGLSIQGWTETEDGDTALLGRFTVISNDYEDDGIFDGDVGELTACVVEAEKYNNRRVCFSFTADGYGEGNEIHDLYALDPVED